MGRTVLEAIAEREANLPGRKAAAAAERKAAAKAEKAKAAKPDTTTS